MLRVAWLFGRLLMPLKGAIYNSRYIATKDKEGLYKKAEDLFKILADVAKREKGQVPYTPSVVKQLTPKPAKHPSK